MRQRVNHVFLKLYKKYYNIIQLMTLYLIFHKFISIFLAQGGLRVRDTLYLAERTLYYTVLHCTATVLLLRYCTTLYYAVLHCTVTVLHCNTLCCALHYTVLHCAALYYNVQSPYCCCVTVLHCTTLYNTVLLLYCTVIHCAVSLYYTVLHYR